MTKRHLPLLLLCLAAASAQAQTSPWYVGGAVTLTRENNLYRLADGAATPAGLSKADLVTSTALLAGLDQPIGRQRLYATATLRADRYRDNGNLDNDGHVLRTGIDWETAGRLSGNIDLSADRNLARFDTDTEIGLQSRRNVEDKQRLFAEARLGVVTAYTLQASLEHRERRFSAPEFDPRESRQTTLATSLRWRPRAGLMLGAGLRATDGRLPRYRTLPGGGVEAQDFRREGLDLLGTLETGGSSRLDGRLTFGRTQYDLSSARDISGATGYLAWTWQPGGRLVLDTRLARDSGQDIYFSGNALFGGTVDDSRTTTALSIGARYALAAKLQLRARLAYTDRELVRTIPDALIPTDALGRDHTTELSLGATWEPTRSLVFGCDLAHESRSASGVLSLPYSAGRAGCFAQAFLR